MAAKPGKWQTEKPVTQRQPNRPCQALGDWGEVGEAERENCSVFSSQPELGSWTQNRERVQIALVPGLSAVSVSDSLLSSPPFPSPLLAYGNISTLKIDLMSSSPQTISKVIIILIKKKGNVTNVQGKPGNSPKTLCLQEGSGRNIPLITSDVTSWSLDDFLGLRNVFPRYYKLIKCYLKSSFPLLPNIFGSSSSSSFFLPLLLFLLLK